LIFTITFCVFLKIAFSLEDQDYRVKIEKGVADSVRDGVKLYATVVRPDAQGKFPVVIIRTPFNQESYQNNTFPGYAAQRGYVVVVQDVRGPYSSEGEFLPYAQEINDGYDSVEWAATLPYSNGKVGTQGCSYLGAIQWQLATGAYQNFCDGR
jgi:putative CocE/NonD family hydrolase